MKALVPAQSKEGYTRGSGFAKTPLVCAALLFICVLMLPLSSPAGDVQKAAKPFRYIDGHAHLLGQYRSRGAVEYDYEGAVRTALAKMDSSGIEKTVVLPHPFTYGQPMHYDMADFIGILKKHPDRFLCMGGGGTLNVMIHKAFIEGAITPALEKDFEEEAAKIISAGAIGFGEMSAEHLSLGDRHPYQSAPPDHPLFLRLADIAAQHGMVIDIHMEAVIKEMPAPERIRSSMNPKTLRPNIDAFEKLLAHNRGAKIVWAHAGWDNTGDRTVAMMSQLLKKHPNLFMNIKIGRDSLPENRPVDEKGLRPEWLQMIRAFPDRFFVGSDEFYHSPRSTLSSPPRLETIHRFLQSLPPDLARKVGYENPCSIFGISRELPK